MFFEGLRMRNGYERGYVEYILILIFHTRRVCVGRGGGYSLFSLYGISHNDAVSCERWRTADALDRTRVETPPPRPLSFDHPPFASSWPGRKVVAEQ